MLRGKDRFGCLCRVWDAGGFLDNRSRVLPILPASYVLGSLVTAEAPGQATDKGLGFIGFRV